MEPIGFFTPVYVNSKNNDATFFQKFVINPAEFIFDFDNIRFSIPPKEKMYATISDESRTFCQTTFQCITLVAVSIFFPLGMALFGAKIYHRFDEYFQPDPLEADYPELAASDLENLQTKGRDFGFRSLSGFSFRRENDYIRADKIERETSKVKENVSLLDSLIKNKQKTNEQIIEELKAEPDLINESAKEYKIHFMPKVDYAEVTLQKILNLFRNNPRLKKLLKQYKILLKNLETNDFPNDKSANGGEFPRIVLYVEGKVAAQLVLNAVFNLFTQEEAATYGCDITPRLNAKVNPLIFYAQGAGGYKERALNRGLDYFLTADGIHFKGDNHPLVIP